MPVRTSYLPWPSISSRRRICVSVVFRLIVARRKQVLQRRQAGSGVFGDARGDTHAAGASGLRGSIANEDAARRQSVDERRGAMADADEHEVRLASPVLECVPIGEGVDEILRSRGLSDVAIEKRAVG